MNNFRLCTKTNDAQLFQYLLQKYGHLANTEIKGFKIEIFNNITEVKVKVDVNKST